MAHIIVLPHPEICPQGTTIEQAQSGIYICKNLLSHGVNIDHVCEMSCACATCHVIVRNGFDSLLVAQDKEDDLLDKAWGVEENSRLSCQAIMADQDLVIEIPRYTVNHAKENA